VGEGSTGRASGVGTRGENRRGRATVRHGPPSRVSAAVSLPQPPHLGAALDGKADVQVPSAPLLAIHRADGRGEPLAVGLCEDGDVAGGVAAVHLLLDRLEDALHRPREAAPVLHGEVAGQRLAHDGIRVLQHNVEVNLVANSHRLDLSLDLKAGGVHTILHKGCDQLRQRKALAGGRATA